MSAGEIRRNGEYHCIAQIEKVHDNDDARFCSFIEENPDGGLLTPQHRNPLREQERAIISLKQIAPEDYSMIMHEFDIDADAVLSNLYQRLGKGDRQLGSQRFEELKNQGLITIERVGFSKSIQPKFYVMVNQPEGRGGNNRFHICASKKGTLRAANRSLYEDPRILSRQNKANRYARAIHHHLGKSSFISRVMNFEPGIRVSELGDENLFAIDVNTLTKEERLTIYIHIIEAVNSLHERRLTHNDLKLENIVICRDSNGSIIGIKIIDLDTLAKEEEDYVREGSAHMIAPERLIRALRTGLMSHYPLEQIALANTKEDLWSAMVMICEMESRVVIASDRLLSQPIIDRFKIFDASFFNPIPSEQSNREKTLAALKRRAQWIYDNFAAVRRDNLFTDIPINASFDYFVYSIAYIDPLRRAPASNVLSNLHYMTLLDKTVRKLQHHRQGIEDYKAAFFRAAQELTDFSDYTPIAKASGAPAEVLQERLDFLIARRNSALQRVTEAAGEELRLMQAGSEYLNALPLDHPFQRKEKILSELKRVHPPAF